MNVNLYDYGYFILSFSLSLFLSLSLSYSLTHPTYLMSHWKRKETEEIISHRTIINSSVPPYI